MEALLAYLKTKNVKNDTTPYWERLLKRCEIDVVPKEALLEDFYKESDIELSTAEEFSNIFEKDLIHIPNRITNIFVETIRKNGVCFPCSCCSSYDEKNSYEVIG